MAIYDLLEKAIAQKTVRDFEVRYPWEVPEEITGALGEKFIVGHAVGSRYTCNPPPLDTDEDYLVLVSGDPYAELMQAGFDQDGSPEFYTGNDAGGFRSWRKGNLNVITTESHEFYGKFMKATHLAKRFNLLEKRDRIALFQVILYDVDPCNLE